MSQVHDSDITLIIHAGVLSCMYNATMFTIEPLSWFSVNSHEYTFVRIDHSHGILIKFCVHTDHACFQGKSICPLSLVYEL